MKVLIDCTPLSAGGGVQGAIALLVNLREQRDLAWLAVVPTSLTPPLPPELADDNRVMLVRKRNSADRVLLSYKLRRVEAAFAPDIVFTVSGPAYFRARAPHVVGFALPHLIYKPDGPLSSPTLFEKFRDWLQRSALRRSDHLVVQTDTVKRRLARRLNINSSKISVIRNCVNPILAHYGGAEALAPERFAFLIPSTYYPHKNLEITPSVAAAMRRLDPALDFEFRFTLEASGFHWYKIAREAEQLGVADRLIALGALKLDELALAYLAASAVFLPTLREASTAVYPESFFFRRPLATSDVDFALELCGEAALFSPPLDAEATARSLVELARSPQLRAQLVETGKKQLLKTYPGPDAKFAMQLELLRSLASTKQTSDSRTPI
jgi:glycosyltransferase involved in cell wall biosynthesis